MSLRFYLGRLEIQMDFWFFFVALLFLICSGEVLLPCIALPILVHEAGHLLFLALWGAKIKKMAFTPFSVDIVRQGALPLSLGREISIGLGGSAANLLAALALYLMAPKSPDGMLLIAANLAVAVFNLLPVGDLDGGEVTRLVCGHFFLPRAARNISRWVSFLALTPLFALSIWLLLAHSGNFTLLLVCCYLAATVIFRD